jgi:hypothetical protein
MCSKRTVQLIIIGLAAFQLLFLTAAIPVHALTSYDVIAAVNALRASYGLPAYAVNNLLMLAGVLWPLDIHMSKVLISMKIGQVSLWG